MTCPDDDTLVALVEHALAPAGLAELEDHVDGCASCRRVIATLAAVAGAAPTPVAASPGAPELAAGTPAGRALGPDGFAPGATIAERYVIERRLGRGGMGTVYLARDVTLGREIAVKVHAAGAGRERLDQEAVALARLAHPNVVTVFELGAVADRRFVAMEYVRGGTLRDHLATPRGWRAIVALMLEAGEGLAAAHRAGLVHRDLKPENILVGDDGRPRVSDFGLVLAEAGAHLASVLGGTDAAETVEAQRQERARPGPPGGSDPRARPSGPSGPLRFLPDVAKGQAGAVGTPARLTETGTLVGTPAYMAPEQLDGGAVDARCDQFAFCVTAWELLYGRRPFAGATAWAIREAIERGAPEPERSEVPARVRRVLVRGLAARAGDRYPDMPALLADLRRALRPRTRRHLGLAAAVLAVAGGAAAVIAPRVAHARRVAACGAEAAGVRALVAPDAKAAVRAAFAATKVAYAASAAERATAVLDRDAATLAARARAACLADEPTPIAAARRRCLAEHRTALAGFVTALEHADAGVVRHATGAAWAIFDPAPCADDRALLAAAPPPRLTPAQGAALAAGRTLLATGKYGDGLARVQPLVAAAHARGDRAAELAGLIVLAQLQDRAGDPGAAVTSLRRAIELAEALGSDLDAAGELAELAGILGDEQRAFPEAHRDVELARAKLARLGGGDRALAAKLRATEGQVLLAELRPADAEPVLRAAAAGYERLYGGDYPELGNVLASLSQVLRDEGKLDDSVAAIRRALAIFQRGLGDDHPLTGGAWLTLGQTLAGLHRYDEAHDALEHADAIFARTLGERHPARAQVLAELGTIELARDHAAAARAATGRALAIVEATQGPSSGFAGALHHDLAQELAAGGRPADALAEDRRSLAIFEGALAKDDPELASPLEGIAREQLALGHPAEAAAAAGRAVALVTAQAGFDPGRAAGLELVLADALWARGDRAGARTIARRAAARQGAGVDHAAIAAWLAGHG